MQCPTTGTMESGTWAEAVDASCSGLPTDYISSNFGMIEITVTPRPSCCSAARKGDVLMKPKSPSVLRCVEEALRCGQRAAIAECEADIIRELEMVVAWLEMAKSQALNGDPLDWGEGPGNGQTPGES